MSPPRRSDEWPLVSVIIPCRNEARFIGPCLESIRTSLYPAERLEVVIADGMSDDGTRDVIARYAADSRITLLDNPRRIAPTGLNLAIRAARGHVILRMDAHAAYPPEYIPRLVSALEVTGADNVGGVIETLPGGETATARAIALGMSHPLGVGNSHFRVGTSTRRAVDHVAFGCWRRTVFDRHGLFDEDLVRGQDVEFNARLIRGGGLVMLLPDVSSSYHARRSLGQVARMFYQYGYFKPLVALKAGRVMTVRQLVPPLFVLALVGAGALGLLWRPAALGFGAIVGAYLALVLGVAAHTAWRRDVGTGLALLAVLPLMHLGYGIGYLRGLGDFLLPFRKARKPAEAVALTR